ncbi:MAG: glycosyltransferase family 2 protein [Candidatus Cloacimonetes bacterium]|nr:glycosyltransferase family 2 protein [Candidatus Cloacimonadota bacterium]
MYKDKRLAVVIPCYNEEKQIESVLLTIPDYVDHILAVDDSSKDATAARVRKRQEADSRIVLLEHDHNQGVGGAIATGYKWARDNGVDIAVVLGGDGQMDPRDLPAILDPVIKGEVDYAKGNRLISGEAFRKIPRIRYFGNSILSMLTKIASGYWHVADSQTGYTAMNRKVLHTIDWDGMYKKYGQPNDILVKLNIYNFRVRDVEINPLYNVGEKSGLKIHRVLFTISYLLLRLFFHRMKEKYIIRDFHPLVFFYAFGFILNLISLPLLVRWIYMWVQTNNIPKVNFLAWMFSVIMGIQFILFAMWFDMESNKHLK